MLNNDDFVIAALVEDGRLTPDHIEKAKRYAAERGTSVAAALVSQNVLSSRDLAIARAQTYEFPFVDIAHYDVCIQNAAKLTREAAESLQAFPLFAMADVTTVGMVNPLDLRAVDQLRTMLRSDIEPVLCEPQALRALIERAYALSGDRRGGMPAAVRFDDASLTTGKEPIVAAVNQIIAQGVELGASDIHLGPDETDLHLRYRVDGTLRPLQGPSLSAHSGIIQRLKVMANLDLTQTRRPQDGKFRFTHNGRNVDLRLSIIPTICGENAVLRILHSGAAIKGFAELGFPPECQKQFEEVIEHPHGMILVTGPTGSGKTTTLYTALKRLNSPDLNIVTIEDPVEIRMPLVRQVQVNSEIGMTFAGALRSVLRQDPDVVFVGEIRDEETARISIQAALTGHLVLSSLHTNDAAGAIPRLIDLGCPSFAINAAVLCVIAQRLVRRTCADCCQAEQPDPLLLRRFGLMPGDGRFVRGRGCARCSNSGYRGRMGVYELLRMTEGLRAVVENKGSIDRISEQAIAEGMKLMWQDGLNKARMGLTTLDELARVVAIASTDTPSTLVGEALERRAAA